MTQHSFLDRYLVFTGSGTIRDADETAPANSDANIVTISTAIGTTNRQWIPGGSSPTNTNTAPSVGSAQSANGWRTKAGPQYLSHCTTPNTMTRSEQITVAAGNWPVRLRYIRDNQTLSGNPTGTVTAILYRLDSAGTFISEIGRVTSATLTFTTTVQTATINVNTAGTTTFNAGDLIQVDLYGVFAAYASVGNANCAMRVDSEANAGSKFGAPLFDLSYSQSNQDPENLTDLSVSKTLTKSSQDVEGLIDIGGKSQRRSLQDAEGLSDLTVNKTQQKNASDPENLTDTNTKSQTRSRQDAENLTDSMNKSQTASRLDTEGLTDIGGKSQKTNRQDFEALTDILNKTQTKSTSDLESITDLLTKSQRKSSQDLANLTDDRNLGRGKDTTDQILTSDYILVGQFDRIHIPGSGGGGSSRTFIIDVSEDMDMQEIEVTSGGHDSLDISDIAHMWDPYDIYRTHGINSDIWNSVYSDSMPLRDSNQFSRILKSNELYALSDSVTVHLSVAETFTPSGNDSAGLTDRPSVVLVQPGTTTSYGVPIGKWSMANPSQKWEMTLDEQ